MILFVLAFFAVIYLLAFFLLIAGLVIYFVYCFFWGLVTGLKQRRHDRLLAKQTRL